MNKATRPYATDEHSVNPAFKAVTQGARLLRFCQQIWQDSDDLDSGWIIDYAIDVDVVKMYSDPVGKAQYADVFGDRGRAALADLLGDFILRRWTPGVGNLWMISPHDDELVNVLAAIQSKAQLAKNDAKDFVDQAAAQIASLLVDLKQGESVGTEDLLNKLDAKGWADRDDFRQLIDWIDRKTGAQRELVRLSMLPKRRVLGLHQHPYFSAKDQNKGLMPLIEAKTDEEVKELQQFHDLIGEWQALLRKHQPTNKRPAVIRADARALAILEWINVKIPKGGKRKLVLITGSKYLFDAAQERSVFADKRLNFAQVYLRDPRCFIGADGFFENRLGDHAQNNSTSTDLANTDGLDITQWLNCFFPEVLKEKKNNDAQKHKYRPEVKFDALEIIENSNDPFTQDVLGRMAANNVNPKRFPEHLYDEWADTVVYSARQRNLDAYHNRNSKGGIEWRSRLGDFFKNIIDQVGTTSTEALSFNHIKNFLIEEINQSQEDLIFIAGIFGTTTLFVGGGQVRGVPALRFDFGKKNVQEKVNQLFDQFWQPFEQQYPVDLNDFYDKLSENDPYNYHAHLIHAVIFAAKGHWSGTQYLAGRAWNAAEAVQREINVNDAESISHRKIIRGREAAYLLAIAARRGAKEVAHLEEAKNWLKKAIERDDDDRATGPKDPRFDSESFAIEIAEIQFRCFSQTPIEYPLFELSSLLSRAASILAALDVDKNQSRASNVDVRSIPRWINRQVMTQIFIASILAFGRDGDIGEDCKKIVLELLKNFREQGLTEQPNSEGKSYPDRTSGFCYHVACLLFCDTTDEKNISQMFLKKYSENKRTGAFKAIFALEARREKNFFDIIEQNTDESKRAQRKITDVQV
jgi:hypothetical protein